MRCFRSSFAITSILLLLGAVSAAGQPSIGPPPGPNIITVAKGGGDSRSIQAAIDSITDASWDNPYLIYVAPGVYEEQITLRDYVDIEGAGEKMTRISSSQGYTVFLEEYPEAELRSLTVECTAGDDEYCAAFEGWVLSPELSQVTVRAVAGWTVGFYGCAVTGIDLTNVTLELINTSGDVHSCGPVVYWDCAVLGPGVTMENVSSWVSSLSCASSINGYRITARNSIVGSLSGTVDLSHVEVFGKVRTSPEGIGRELPTVRHSVIHGRIDYSGWEGEVLSISHSQVDGEVENGGARCFSVHDADLNPLDENCQPNPPPGEDPHADFSFSVTGRTVHFLNQSTGTQPLSYSWDFGDGTNSSETDPTHTYAIVGTYNVSLTVTNQFGTDSIMKTVTVED